MSACAAEWNTLRHRIDVRSPSGRPHIAGAESSWLVSSVTFKGLLRVVKSEDAVPNSLLILSVVFSIEVVEMNHLGVSSCCVYVCKALKRVPSMRSPGMLIK